MIIESSTRNLVATGSCAVAILLLSGTAHAHVSIVSGNAPAQTTQDVVFNVEHGCDGETTDTYQLSVDIPAGFGSVRPVYSPFGPATVTKDAGGTVTNITWTRAGDVIAGDSNNYRFAIRLKTPNAPFTTVYFPTHQVCKAPTGSPEAPVEWTDLPSAVDGGTPGHPAPALRLVGAHVPGWNTYTLAVDIPVLSVYFGDAAIVWKGGAAYSANANTTAQIGATAGVTALGALKSGDVISVKY